MSNILTSICSLPSGLLCYFRDTENTGENKRKIELWRHCASVQEDFDDGNPHASREGEASS